MKQRTKQETLDEIFSNDPYGLLDGTFQEKRMIRIIDKVSKKATYLFIPFFIWVFYQIIVNA